MRIHSENRNSKLTIFEEDNFSFLSAHWHTQVELAYVLEGSIIVGVNNERKLLREGEAVVLGSGDIHYYDGTNHLGRMLLLLFDPKLVTNLARWPENRHFVSNYITEESKASLNLNEIKELLYLVKERVSDETAASELFIRSHLLMICGLILQHIPTVSSCENPKDRTQLKLKLLQDIFTYIEDNYNQDITVSSIIRRFNISEKYFSKLFNSISRINFKTHLNTIRIERAENLILSSKQTLTEVAFECGFNSIRTFNRVYKSIRGHVPSSLR